MKKTKYLMILLVAALLIIGVGFLKNIISPDKIYLVESQNLAKGGSFENFNKTVGDCCNSDQKNSIVYASRSIDSYLGEYSLNLTSENQCACTNIPVNNLGNSDVFLLSLYSKGDNPKVCSTVGKDIECLDKGDIYKPGIWVHYSSVFTNDEDSINSLIYFYANSDGTISTTNLYDNVQINKLILIKSSKEYEYNESRQYIIKTRIKNQIHNGHIIGGIKSNSGEAFFLTEGKPDVTISFSLIEIVIMLFTLFLIIKLLFREKHNFLKK